LGFIYRGYVGLFVGYVLGVWVWDLAGVDMVGGFSLGRGGYGEV